MVIAPKKILAAAAALACMGSAHAGFITQVIDFENVNTSNMALPPLAVHGDEFYQSGFWIDALSNVPGAIVGQDLVGALVDGTDVANTCVNIACPTNNSSRFYTSVDDGFLSIGTLSGLSFTLNSFSAAFIGDVTGLFTGIPGRIIFQGVRASDGVQQAFIGGNLTSNQFANYTISATSALRTTAWSQMFIFSQTCSTTGSCTSFNNDRGQFALDNLSLNVIPEPGTWALAGVALAGLAAARRRRAV